MVQGMCDQHLDALSCMQSAVSRGFHTDSLRDLAQIYIEHGFLTDDEADIFLSEIPVLGEREESETTVSDQMLDLAIVLTLATWFLGYLKISCKIWCKHSQSLSPGPSIGWNPS